MTAPAFAGAIAYAFFDTPLGRCAVAWGPRGIVALHLPETRESAARARVLRRFPEATEGVPTPDVRQVQAAVVALLRGETDDLSAIPLDMTGVPDFHARVYEAARAIPPGGTSSYGEVAAKAGSPGAARAVGQALGRNPFAIIVPCHRVLAAGGKVGGFSAQGGPTTKIKLLSIEGAAASNTLALFDGDGAFGFDPVMAVAHLRAADPALARVMDAAGPFRMKIARAPSLFVALAEAIVYQQLSGKAAATIFARVRALFPRGHEGPTAAQILRASDEKLRGAGLSRGKLLALRDLAQKSVSGEVPTLAEANALDDEALIERLVQVRGIGRWTVEMLLMFRLGRPDVLPADDLGVRKGFAYTYRKRTLPTKEQLEKGTLQWQPYRSVASWYMWRAAELAQKKGAA
jgi:methylated-DNA-[protein]-cysteine S-methyltransferase